MAGAILALTGAGGGAGGGGGTLGALGWGPIFGAQAASNPALTISGITGTHSLQAALSSRGGLGYTHNGAYAAYAGAFTVVAGDTLGWTVTNPFKGEIAGTVTVTDATTGQVIGVFAYDLTGSGNQ